MIGLLCPIIEMLLKCTKGMIEDSVTLIDKSMWVLLVRLANT